MTPLRKQVPGRWPARLRRDGERLLARMGILRGRWLRGQISQRAHYALPGLAMHRNWRYGLYAPGGLPDDDPAPLIIVLHGCRQRALRFAEASGWMAQADRLRLRLLCPDQRRWSNMWRCWNWFDPRAQRGEGELAVMLAMLDDAGRRVHVHPQAVAVVGLSAGGAMASLLAFRHPDRIQAAVAVASPPLIGNLRLQSPRHLLQHGLMVDPALALGAMNTACAPLAILHGSRDPVVHPRCADQLLDQALESLRRARLAVDRDTRDDERAAMRITDCHAGGTLRVRRLELEQLAHGWTGGPGGHPFCERAGPPLADLCAQFLAEAGVPIAFR